MLIDIIQAYADALHVATTLRPAPPARGSRSTPSRDDAEARPAPTPSPTVLRRLARSLMRQVRQAGGLGSGAELTAAPTGPKGCG
jgi:hypothetical protein